MPPSLTTIDDLPNELLDEIFSYLHSHIDKKAIKPLNTVCRRWNRPFMTQKLTNTRLPKHINLQAKFPKLTYFRFLESAKYNKDFSLFKGHSFLKVLDVAITDQFSCKLKLVLIYPRLTSLTCKIPSEVLFSDNGNLERFVALLPQLGYLKIEITCSECSWKYNCNGMLEMVLQRQPKDQRKQLKLKHLAMNIQAIDLTLFCELFQTSSLDHLEILNIRDVLEADDARKYLDFFPKVRSLVIRWPMYLIFREFRFENVTTLKLLANPKSETWNFADAESETTFESETLNFSSLLNHFPNVESLDTGDHLIVFDLEYPTRLTLTHSKMAFADTVKPRLFSRLESLEWTIDTSRINKVMQQMGKHCPHLTTIKFGRNDWCTFSPKLDNIVFPVLVSFEVCSKDFQFNSSFFRFLARHGQLKSLQFHEFTVIKFEDDWKPIESDQVLWPNLRVLRFPVIDDHHCLQEIRDWFLKNAPNVTDFQFKSDDE